MEIKRNTNQKFNDIWGGLGYHIAELSRFFVENEDDPFLKTEYGKTMERHSKIIASAYAMGGLSYVSNKMSNMMKDMFRSEESNKQEELEETGKATYSMEDMLESIFGAKDEKKEDEEP